jgi:hypothetical protein
MSAACVGSSSATEKDGMVSSSVTEKDGMVWRTRQRAWLSIRRDASAGTRSVNVPPSGRNPPWRYAKRKN